MKKNILVVGGTGFIGYHLIKLLLKKKYTVTSISTKKPKKIRKINSVKYLYLDISNYKNLNVIKQKFDYVVNLGGYIDHTNKKLTYKSHYLGCKNLVKFFEPLKVKSFVQIGSSLEYGGLNSPQLEHRGLKPLSVYSMSKLLATKFLINKFKIKKFPSIILRGYQVYGPRQDNNRLVSSVICNCLKNKKFSCSSGEQSRDFVYVEDFVYAIYKSLNNKNAIGKIINIGYGKPTRVKDIITFIRKVIKKGKPNFNKIKLRKDETMILYPSIIKAKNILSWKPKVNLYKGLIQTILDYKKILK